MTEAHIHVTRQSTGTTSANVINRGRPLFVLRDIPGPHGLALMDIPWTLRIGGEEIASGRSDDRGRVIIHNALQPAATYELEYTGRIVQLPSATLSPGTGTEGLQQRLVLMGYSPGAIDGEMGPTTDSALRNFQLDHDLVVDGIPGPSTLDQLP